MGSTVEFVSEEGILRFDGTVLEIFGFGHSFSNRMHVQHLTNLEKIVKRDRIVLDISGKGSMVVFLPLSDEESLDEFIAVVEAAGPNSDF